MVFFAQIGLQQYCFLVFLLICSSTAMYIFFIIPETKNKTFLEIQNEFRSSRKSNSHQADGVSTTLLISSSMWLHTIFSGVVELFISISQKWMYATRTECPTIKTMDEVMKYSCVTAWTSGLHSYNCIGVFVCRHIYTGSSQPNVLYKFEFLILIFQLWIIFFFLLYE